MKTVTKFQWFSRENVILFVDGVCEQINLLSSRKLNLYILSEKEVSSSLADLCDDSFCEIIIAFNYHLRGTEINKNDVLAKSGL